MLSLSIRPESENVAIMYSALKNVSTGDRVESTGLAAGDLSVMRVFFRIMVENGLK